MTLRLSILAVVTCVLSLGRQAPSLDSLASTSLAVIDGTTTISGLRSDVRIVRDSWGVPHIYAQSADDLFFAQGYVMAQDRLWQMEVWRRTGEGRLSEILGPSALPRDRVARLLKYRGAIDDRELTPYHPEAKRLMTAYVSGINTFIAANQTKLPVEFVLTGIRPAPWTIDALVLRQTVFGDATGELQLARSVAQLGAAEANRRRNPDPSEELAVPDGLDVAAISAAHDALTAATRVAAGPVMPEVLPNYRSMVTTQAAADGAEMVTPGSNNWVINGSLSCHGQADCRQRSAS